MNKFIKVLKIVLHFITLGTTLLIEKYRILKKLALAADLNKDGKVSFAEIKKVSKDVFDGKAEIKIEYKK